MTDKKYISSYPNLLEQWDWEKNNILGIRPECVSHGSERKIHWKCLLGHEWVASASNRVRGQGCPICAGRKIQIGYNDLDSKYPDLSKEWHPSKNGNLLPTQVTPGSQKRIWWLCSECANEWQTSVSNRVAGKGCPICDRKKQQVSKSENLINQNGSFASNYPELLKEWNYEKNILDPKKITKNSTYRVWWCCVNCGHEWTTSVRHRTERKSGCPACSNKVTTNINCLETTHSYIIKKWNHERNLHITPRDITAGSNKKVWWICEFGHEWQATVTSIVNGGSCPVCCGQRVLEGFNDLATVNPALAAEWHPVRNGGLLPTQITSGSSKTKIWWICPKGHEFQSTVANRSRRQGCPICEKERKTSFPEQAIFHYLGKIVEVENRYLFDGKFEIDIYIPEFRTGIEYDGYYYHASPEARLKEQKKDAILFENGISIIHVKEVKDISICQDSNQIIYCRNAGNYLYLKDVILKIIQRIPAFNQYNPKIDINIERDSADIMSRYIQMEKENSLAIKYPELASEWHPTRNGFVMPEMLSYSSGKKVWWLGKCGHEWQSAVEHRIKGTGCPICNNKVVLKGFNDLTTTNPELAREWDFDKNLSLTPDGVTYGSDKKVWWICSKGHSYQAAISNRSSGKNCPYCSNIKILEGYNDLAFLFPEIAAEWDYKKNKQTPDNVLPGSNKSVWWKCKKCGHEWMTNPNHRVYRHSGCPACSGRVATDEANLLVTNLELCNEWNEQRNEKGPDQYRPNSNQKVWWKCSICKFEWKASISQRHQGSGCPCCAGKVAVPGVNDLMTVKPKLALEWNYDKNLEIQPTDVTIGTHKKVWWKCSVCGHEWLASISNRSSGRGCPVCGRKGTNKSKEKAIFQYTSKGIFIKEYSSIKDAIGATGIKSIAPSSPDKKTSGGYIWLLEKDDEYALEIANTINKSRVLYKRLPVLQYSLDGTFIMRYSSSAEAERQNNISRSKVGECCRGKRKTAGGFIWKYETLE